MFSIVKIKKFFLNQFYIFKFISNNKKIFSQNQFDNEKKILVELFEFKPSYLSFSYYANILKKKHRANILFYKVNNINFFKKIIYSFKAFLSLEEYGLAKSLGCNSFIFPKVKVGNNNLKKKIINQIKTKKDILNIKIKNINVGDLFYDEYLYSNNLPTINIKDKNFKKFILSSIDLFLFWYEIIEPKNIKSVIISHATYFRGIPGRIAIAKKIPCYNVSNNFSYYLNKKYPRRTSNFDQYPKLFNKIPKNLSKLYLKEAKKKIIKNFIGSKTLNYKIKHKNKKKLIPRVLIASHCFTDAVHIHGKNIFTDYYDWIKFLGKISEKLDYNWTIKIHPNEYDNNIIKMLKITNQFPKLRILPKKSDNKKLIKNIDYVLTIYGSVAREYPIFNIPVINASNNGPYHAYKFCVNTSSLKEYKKLILNIKKIYVKKNEIKKVYEFYSIRYLLDFYFLGLNNAMKINKILSKDKSSEYLFFKLWLEKFNENKHISYLKIVEKFIRSKKHHFTVNNLSKKREFLNLK